jgi:hypothetical protein
MSTLPLQGNPSVKSIVAPYVYIKGKAMESSNGREDVGIIEPERLLS